MSDRNLTAESEEWAAFANRVNESFLDAVEANVEAQTEFIETWSASLEDGSKPSVDTEELLDSYARAFEIWMDSATTQYEELLDGLEEGDVSASTLRDRWLASSNEAFKEVMTTSAFATTTGRALEQLMEAQQAADAVTEETLHGLGFATRSDVREVGKRLVELERRQHAIERNLEQVLDELSE